MVWADFRISIVAKEVGRSIVKEVVFLMIFGVFERFLRAVWGGDRRVAGGRLRRMQVADL